MKATKIYYKKLFSLGNYQNEEIGIEIEIEKGEKAKDVLKKAKLFVESLNPQAENEREYNEAVEILKNKEIYNYKKVMEAQKFIDSYSACETDELPF